MSRNEGKDIDSEKKGGREITRWYKDEREEADIHLCQKRS